MHEAWNDNFHVFYFLLWYYDSTIMTHISLEFTKSSRLLMKTQQKQEHWTIHHPSQLLYTYTVTNTRSQVLKPNLYGSSLFLFRSKQSL